MRRLVLALSLVCTMLFIVAPSAHAARMSGKVLREVCGVDEDGDELEKNAHLMCENYIAGVLDYHNLVRSLGTSPSVDFCVPQNVSLESLRKIVFTYLVRNRQHDSFIAAPAIALALYEAYPCGGKKKK